MYVWRFVGGNFPVGYLVHVVLLLVFEHVFVGM